MLLVQPLRLNVNDDDAMAGAPRPALPTSGANRLHWRLEVSHHELTRQVAAAAAGQLLHSR